MSRINEEKRAETQKQEERNQAMERKRKQLLQMTRSKEAALKERAKIKIEQDEARRAEQQRNLKRENELLKAEKDILMAMKQENLARIKRMQEYQQKETLRKVALNDKKSAEMKKKKAELLAIRKKNAHAAKIKKDELMAVLDQTRGSGGSSKIKKLLKKLSTDGDQILGSPSHKSSLKSKHDDNDTVQTDQLSIDIGPPPEIPSCFSCNKEDDKTLQPYQSPYATMNFAMDDVLGLRNLRLKEPLDGKSL
jgi:hypothetical protein